MKGKRRFNVHETVDGRQIEHSMAVVAPGGGSLGRDASTASIASSSNYQIPESSGAHPVRAPPCNPAVSSAAEPLTSCLKSAGVPQCMCSQRWLDTDFRADATCHTAWTCNRWSCVRHETRTFPKSRREH